MIWLKNWYHEQKMGVFEDFEQFNVIWYKRDF